MRIAWAILLTCAVWLGCTHKNSAQLPATPESLLTRGRAIYQANCTACHNSDPHKPGAIGPEIFGSPQNLIEARVMRAQYPEGYKPKRDTHVMQALPQLKDEIPALAQYLNSRQ